MTLALCACTPSEPATSPAAHSAQALEAPPPTLPRVAFSELAPALQRFDAWVLRWDAAGRPEAGPLFDEGVLRAVERRAAFRLLLSSEPLAALSLATPPPARAGFPSAIAAQLETWLDGVGDFAVVGGTPMAGAPAAPTERFVTLSGATYRAQLTGRREGYRSATGLRLHGVALDGYAAFTDSPLRRLSPGEAIPELPFRPQGSCPVSRRPSSPEQVYTAGDVLFGFCQPGHADTLAQGLSTEEAAALDATLGSAWTQGPKSVLFIRADFSDRAGDPLSAAAAQALIDTQVDNFYRANSFELTTLSTVVTPTVRLPKTQADYQANANSYLQLLQDARVAARDAGFETNDYPLDVVAFAGTYGGWAGRGYVGSKGTWLNGDFSLRVAGHELGHNYGVNHANLWVAPGGSVIGTGSNQEYGNPFDIMGGGGGAANHFNAWFKRTFDWLLPAELQTVTTSGTFRLYPLEVPLLPGQLRALKVPRNDSSSRDYWVEFRQAFTSNASAMNGALVTWGYPSNGPGSHLLDLTPYTGTSDAALVIGRTFSDPWSGVHLTPIGKGGTTPQSLDVVVNLGQFPGNRAPTVSLAATATSAAPGASLTFTATATDADGDALAYDWDFDDGALGPNAATATHAWGAARFAQVRCTVSDMKGKTASASVLVTVGAPTRFKLSGNVTQGALPLGGVRISDGARSTFSGTDGAWVLTEIAAGDVTLTATQFDLAFTRGFAAPLAVSADTAGLAFTAAPRPGYAVAGKVSVGTGLGGVTVSDGTRTAVSNAAGDFSVGNVPNGRFTLTASKPGWVLVPSFKNPLEVLGGNLTGQNFYAQGAYVQGSVTNLTVMPVVTDGVRVSTAYLSGTSYGYNLQGVPAGTWNLTGTAPGFILTPSNFTNPVTVTGNSAGPFNFAATPGTAFKVSGVITTGGVPLPGVVITSGSASSTTDGLGRYVLPNLAPGALTLTPARAGYTFSPASAAVTVVAADVVQDFTTVNVNPPPTVATAAQANPNPVVTGVATSLSALGADDTGEAALTYTWASTNLPTTVSFSANGTNAAKATTATFSQAGTYTLEVTLRDPGGLPVRSSVTVPVQQVLQAVEVSPATANVMTLGTQGFFAQGKDQFAKFMYPGAASWAVTGGGTLTGGTFTAGATPGGPFILSASAGGKTGTAVINVVGAGAPSLTKAAFATPDPVAGTSTALAVSATDDQGEAGLTYTWSATLGPAPVTFTPNGTNAAKASLATFTAAGDYALTVTIVDGANNTISSLVNVTVLATPTQVVVTPATVTVEPGAAQSFLATGADQFGAPLAAPPLWQWAVSDGGVISTDGTFTAGALPGGPFGVTATAAALTGTASVTIADGAAPQVALTAPVAGQRVDGALTLEATASDAVGVTVVRFLVDGSVAGEATAPPYTAQLDAAALAPGPHTALAMALDAAGNVGTSAPVEFVKAAPPDTTAPTVKLLAPFAGAVPLAVEVQVEASDAVGVTAVQVRVDGAVAATLTNAPWSAQLMLTPGPHALEATAADAAGNVGRSAQVQVTAAATAPVGSTVLGGCGCGGAAGGAGWLGLLTLLALTRRRARG